MMNLTNMKLKHLILFFFIAVAMTNCNNDVSMDDPFSEDPGYEKQELTYATITLSISDLFSYGGVDSVLSRGYETSVYDAAMFVYRWDGANNLRPEAMAYLPNSELGNPKALTLMVTSGLKKIFMAVNIKNQTVGPLLNANNGIATTAVKDTGIVLSSTNTFAALNWTIRSTDLAFATPATTPQPVRGTEGGSSGLIRTLAGGSIRSSAGVMYTTMIPGADCYCDELFCLMTNWDGPHDKSILAGKMSTSDCVFTLSPDISAQQSKMSSSSNNVKIGVQRGYAKISLRITADGARTNTSYNYYGPYESAEDDGSKGKFTVWKAGTPAVNVWSLGGINKQMYPFQSFRGTKQAVASPNWALSTGDTIHRANPAGSDAWYDSYDNTRVFGSGKTYFTAGNTMDKIKAAMTGYGSTSYLPNYLPLSPANGRVEDLQFAMCTENGTEFPQIQDRGTFVIVGGTYAPRNVITEVKRAGVTTNPSEIGWNGFPSQPNINSTGYGVNTYYPLLYDGGNDSLYYLVMRKTFIYGRENLEKFYAWELKNDKDSDNPSTSVAVAHAIKVDKAAEDLFSYYRGQCFYRLWVRDPGAKYTSSDHDEVLVRRNHIYEINLNRIKGPGIENPNRIIIPGQQIPEEDTFVSAEVNILLWHDIDVPEPGGAK